MDYQSSLNLPFTKGLEIIMKGIFFILLQVMGYEFLRIEFNFTISSFSNRNYSDIITYR